MPRFACLLILCGTAVAAPVPKEKPDPLPDGTLVRLGSSRFRGQNTDGVSFSKDGKTLYGTDDKNTVFRWDAATGKPLEPITFDVKDTVCSRVRGDRAFIVEHPTPNQGAHDSIVHIFDLPSGKSRGKFDPKWYVRLTQANPGLHQTDITADGRWFAVRSHSSQSARVFDVSGDEPAEVFSTKFTDWGSVLLSPDGGRLLVYTDDSNTKVYDVKSGDTLCTITAEIPNAAFTPDGMKLIGYPWVVERMGNMTTKTAGRLTVWDVATGKELANPDIEGTVWQFTPSITDTVFVGRSVKDVQMLTGWNLKADKEVWSAPVPIQVPEREKFVERGGSIRIPPIPVFAVSPDGKRVAVSDRFGRICLLDGETGKRLDNDPASNADGVQWVELSADGKTAYSATHHDYREWDAGDGQLKAAHTFPDVKHRGFVGATDQLLVWWEWKGVGSKQETFAWDRKTKKEVWRVDQWGKAHTAGDAVVFQQAKGEADRFLVYDPTGKERDQFELKSSLRLGELTGFSAETLFQYGEGKLGVMEFNMVGRSLKTGEKTVTCGVPFDPNKFSGTYLIDPSADGKYLGLGMRAGDWMVAEVATGKVLASGRYEKHNVAAMPISSDGSKVLVRVTDQPVVRVFELKKDGKTWTLDGKGAAASAVAFSPDGTKAVVGYRDGTALIWDVSK